MTWPTVRLGDVAEVVSGATPRRDVAEYWDGSIPWVTPAELRNLGSPDLVQTRECITPAGLRSCSAKLLPPGSVLFSSRAPIGHVAINAVPVATNQGFKSLVPKPGLDARFLYRVMRNIGHEIDARASGTTFKEVTKREVEQVVIPLPPLDEQRRIADILDRADEIRRKREESLKLIDDLLQSVFLDMFGDPVTNPKGWPVKRGSDVFRSVTYGTNSKCYEVEMAGAVGVLRIPNISRAEVDDSDLKYAVLDPEEEERLALVVGDLLFVRSNGNPDYIARCAVVEEPTKHVYASYLIRCRLKPNSGLLPEILLQQASTPTFRSKVVREARTTAGNYNISGTGLRNLTFTAPPLSKQRRFVEMRAALLRSSQRAAEALNEVRMLTASLTQRAFRREL